MKVWRYTVRGRGTFPLDMLRHDRSCPDASDDVNKMLDDERGERDVTLVTYLPSCPTEGRWNSFGWRLVVRPREIRL